MKSKALNKAIKEADWYILQRHGIDARDTEGISKWFLSLMAKIILTLTVLAIFTLFIILTSFKTENAEVGVVNQNNDSPIETYTQIAESPICFLQSSDRFTTSAAFTVTHYCGCPKCCGKWSGGSEEIAYGKSGTKLTPCYSIAVDPDVIPLGTICYDMEGNPYEAVDTGSKIKGNHIDMFVGNHQQAVNLGIKTMQLYW